MTGMEPEHDKSEAKRELDDEAKQFLVGLLGPNFRTFEYSDEAKAEFQAKVESGEWEREVKESTRRSVQRGVDTLAKRGFWIWPPPIPVNERLPENGNDVFFFPTDLEGWMSGRYLPKDYGGFVNYCDEMFTKVSHWLPMPPPPE